MIKTFEVRNVKCEGCANTLKNKLSDFKDVNVNLNMNPRLLTIDIEDDQIPELKERLMSIGYPVIDDEMSRAKELRVLVSSYVSCMVGKMN